MPDRIDYSPSGEFILKVRRRNFRERQFERFARVQRRKRAWFSFREIVDWCARESEGTVSPTPDAHRAAADALIQAAIAGQFTTHRGLGVLYLEPGLPIRMTEEILENMLITHRGSLKFIREDILNRCWLPRALCQKWFQSKGISLPSFWFPQPSVLGPQAHPKKKKNVRKKDLAPHHQSKRGPKPLTLKRVEQAMREELESGKITTCDFRVMKQESLASRYGVSRDTVVKAREHVLLQFVDPGNSDKTPANSDSK